MTYRWQQVFDGKRFHLIKSDDFSVKIFSHSCFGRYSQGHHDLTLFWKKADDSPVRKRGFWRLFSNYPSILMVPSQLTWDDGAPLSEEESITALRRFCEALSGYFKTPCSIAVDDNLYEEMQRDVDEIRRELGKPD
jgi:hypothetical protein